MLSEQASKTPDHVRLIRIHIDQRRFESPSPTSGSELYRLGNKPPSGRFDNFFEKIESYVGIISGPAIELYKANPLTFRVTEDSKSYSPFKFRDTMTARAEIGDLAAQFQQDVIAVIGLGGTGGYPQDRAKELRDKKLAELVDDPDDIYHTNIQIGELNALNACLAVIRFKQLRGFYLDEAKCHHLLLGIDDLKIAHDGENIPV